MRTIPVVRISHNHQSIIATAAAPGSKYWREGRYFLTRNQTIPARRSQQVIRYQMHIFVGDFNALMAEHVLYLDHIESFPEQEGSTGVAQAVKVDGFLESGFQRMFFEDLWYVVFRQGKGVVVSGSGVQEYQPTVWIPHKSFPGFQPVVERVKNRNRPLFSVFCVGHPQEPVF